MQLDLAFYGLPGLFLAGLVTVPARLDNRQLVQVPSGKFTKVKARPCFDLAALALRGIYGDCL